MTSVDRLSAGTPDEARVGIAERLRARRAEIDEAIFARVSDRWFDRAGSGDPEYVAGLRAAGVAALDYVLTGVERSGRSLEPVPAAVLTQARRAARAGVGLETVLRRYLAGHTLLQGFVIQEAEHGERESIPPTQESALRDLLGIISELVDRVITAASGAYNKEIEQKHLQPSRLRDLNIRADRMKISVSERHEHASRRDLIIAAIVEVVSERGCVQASVGLVLERARVSRLTFYKVFPGGLDDGLVAVIDTGLERVGAIVSQALEREVSWRDGMRAALAAVLLFFDSEPDLARVLMVQTLGGGPLVLEHREERVEAFRALVVARIEHEIPNASPLAAEGVLASVMSVVRARLIARESRPLIELLGPLLGLVVEHVADWEMAAEEARRGDELVRAIKAGEISWALPPTATVPSEPPLPAMLANPAARRLRECLLFLAEQGVRELSPSNREIGTAIGVSHKSQISKLLSQLHAEDLAVKRSIGPGGPNEWRLTPYGEETARALPGHKG
jgi:AcrR family transcriptional regulator